MSDERKVIPGGSRVTIHKRCWLLLITLCGAGCSQQQAAENANAGAERPAVVVIPEPTGSMPAGDPQPPPPPKQPEPPPPTFTFPADLGGQVVAKAVAPDVSRPLPAARFATVPRPRAIPAKFREPGLLPRAASALPPLLTTKTRAASKPADPPEQLPPTLGAGADAPPARPVLPVAKVETPRARDVNLPPPAPALGRPASDRVPLDDPTSELGNATVVATPPAISPPPSGFLKVAVPDPFELGAQVKPKVPPTAEPSAAPVVVNPQRVK
jgi:hypothetical protein